MSKTPHSQTKKIECRLCGCRMNTVTQTSTWNVTYHGKARTIIKRHRKCRHCGLQFNTIETYEDEENTNLPEDVQPFRPAPHPSGIPGVYKHTIPLAAGNPDEHKAGHKHMPFPPEKPKASRRKRK